MTVYTFRVSLEDDENIYRNIEVPASFTIDNFKAGIFKAFDLSARDTIHFFKGSSEWKKGKPVTRAGGAKLSSIIENQRQRFIAEIKNSMFGNYLIELITMDGNFDAKAFYPRVVKKYGFLPGSLLEKGDDFNPQVVLDDKYDDLDDLDELED